MPSDVVHVMLNRDREHLQVKKLYYCETKSMTKKNGDNENNYDNIIEIVVLRENCDET